MKSFDQFNQFSSQDKAILDEAKKVEEFNEEVKSYLSEYGRTLYKDICKSQIDELQISDETISLKIEKIKSYHKKAENELNIMKKKKSILRYLNNIKMDSIFNEYKHAVIQRIELERDLIENCQTLDDLYRYDNEVVSLISDITKYLYVTCDVDSLNEEDEKEITKEQKEIIDDFEDVLIQNGKQASTSLDNFSCLSNMALRKPDLLIGREKELQSLIYSLSRRNKPNAIILGEPGIGKTAIVEELAYLIKNKKVPSLKGKAIYALDIGSLVSNTKYRGEFEDKLNKIINEVIDRKNVILFVDEIHALVKAGGAEGAIDAASILKPYLSRGKIQMIGASTEEEFNVTFGVDKALRRRFQLIHVDETSVEETINILEKSKSIYERFHKIKIDSSLIEMVVHYSDTYLMDRYFPDKAIELLDSACARANEILTKEDIEKALYDNYHVDTNDKNVIKQLELDLKDNVFGQDSAIKKVLNNLAIMHHCPIEDNRPLGVLAFVGPTGVGKRLTTSYISKDYFQDKCTLYLNMTMYSDYNALDRLVGINPSTRSDSVFVKHLKTHPNSFIVFDKIENANPEVVNFLTNAIEMGHFYDATGDRISLKNTTLLFIVNNSHTSDLLNTKFLSKMDETIEFKPLKEDGLKQIISKQLKRIDPILALNDQVIDDIYHLSYEYKYIENGGNEVRKKLRSNYLALAEFKNQSIVNYN